MTFAAVRPAYNSQLTSTTDLSSSTASRSSVSRSSAGYHSTALTSPSLGQSPKLKGGLQLQGLVEVFEGSQATHDTSKQGLGIAHLDLSRSGTVRDRASLFENQAVASSSTTPSHPPSTTPLRIKRRVSQGPAEMTPRKSSRVPVPRSTPPSGPRRVSPGIKRGAGSARKMIQKWEAGPGTPGAEVTSAGRAGVGAGTGEKIILSRDYLNAKPLPVPGPAPRTPQAQKTRPNTYKLSTPPKSAPSNSSYHLQTPQQRSFSPRTPLSTSPSSSYSLNHSLSPSGDIRPKRKGKSPLSERSPLKEILQVFGGGIHGRKAKARGRKDVSPSPSMDQLGSNGLPGGIVYRDRMGDNEMGGSLARLEAWSEKPQWEDNVVKASPIIYLVPTPCSSYSPWGSWLPSHATLTATSLRVTYTPVFSSTRRGSLAATGSGPQTPRDSTPPPPATFAKVPLPEEGQRPDVELAMKECVEVRSLRRDEIKGRGVPRLPDMNGVEVLELLWEDGSKRYLGVDGVAGRLGWVSAIWDVLLACKSNIPLTLPPPSPQTHSPRKVSGLRVASGGASSLALFPFPAAPQPKAELSDFQARIVNLEAKSTSSAASAQPVQKVGGMWVATSGALRIASGSGTVDEHRPSELHDSVKRMFELGSQEGERLSLHEPWQPTTERDLSIFARGNSERSTEVLEHIIERTTGSPVSSLAYKQSSTELSFDPNDLNPSRSASQVRRASSSAVGALKGLGKGHPSMSRVDEVNSREPSLITRMTFPKPLVGGIDPRPATPSTSSESTYLPTPRTLVAADHFDASQIMSRMESHSLDHVAMAKQIEGVHVNVETVIQSLSTLAKQQTEEEARSHPADHLEERLSALHLDFRGVQDALQLNALAGQRVQPSPTDLGEVNSKLDAITRLCEDALARHEQTKTVPGALVITPEDEKTGGAEVADIMTPIILESPDAPNTGSPEATVEDASPRLPDGTMQHIQEVLEVVKDLQGARTVQTQQTTDIARYLNELNGWLEKFVKNGTSELAAMSSSLEGLAGEIAPVAMVSEVHAMVSEQKRRNDAEGLVGQRLDALLQMMGEDKARHTQQQTALEQVAGMLERQRNDSEMLLRALATDLTGEIRGERIRFIEAMQQATSVNVQLHMDEFKKLLSQEVHRAINELGQMREQKMALEAQISDLFALKSKHAPGQPARSPARQQSPLPPAGMPRTLPVPMPR